MARRIENPEWRESWYNVFQTHYKEWMKQAPARGVRDSKGDILHKVGEIEKFLAEELHITPSVVHSWSREKRGKGATYPESEEMLHKVWRLLRKSDVMSSEERAATSALYRDFCHLIQESGRKFIYERAQKYRKLMKKYEIYEPSTRWKHMDMERRCELVERLKGRRLSKEEADSLLDFYTSISAPENCGANLFRQICDSDLVWAKAEKLLKRCDEARDLADTWLDRAVYISKKMIAPNIRFAPYYWRIMDEYLDELLNKISDQGKVKDFNLVRMAVGGYVPLSFEVQFAFDNADYAAMREEYLYEPLRYETITRNAGGGDNLPSYEIHIADYADLYGWLRREKEEYKISVEDYRMRRRYALRQEVLTGFQQTGKVERVLEELVKMTGLDEYRRLLPEYSEVSIVDWILCIMSASERHRKENPGVFRLGFACEKEAREAFRFFEDEPMTEEDRKAETAVQYILQIIKTFFFPSLVQTAAGRRFPVFSAVG